MTDTNSGNLQQKQEPIQDIDILWITAGLDCDGERIAMTGTTQPSIEDIVLSAIPPIPKANFHNPVVTYEVRRLHEALLSGLPKARVRPLLFVMEGSIPEETNKQERHWATFGTDPKTGQLITNCEWIDVWLRKPG